MQAKALKGHMDADCFYVSCECVRSPELRKLPVGVLSNQGACVIAKSYELKAAGVKTAMAVWDAQPLCPDAIFIKRDFRWYEVVSRKLLEITRRVSPEVEYYSIDEQFFCASYLERFFRCDIQEAARKLQQLVLEEVGIPVSIGIAPTRTYAKLLSSSVKPFGVGVVTEPQTALNRFYQTPVDKITGIARRSKEKLLAYSIRTCGDLARAERKLVRKLLTKKGEELWWELNGTPTKPILTSKPPNKEIARGGSVGRVTADRDKLVAWIARNTERLVEGLDFHQVYTDEITFIIRHKSGLSFGGRKALPLSTADFYLLFNAAHSIFEEVWQEGRLVRHMHVIASKLCIRSSVQLSLYDNPSESKLMLAKVKREINEKVGRFALRSALTLPLFAEYHDEASDYETSDIYGTTCF